MNGLTVFIPVYNEAGLLEPNLRRLAAHLDVLNRPYQIIVGSNGSTDATAEIGRRLAREMDQVVFFHLPRRGPGLAFREALKLARHDLILTQDMDLSVDLAFIPQALDLLAQADLVVGSKRMGTQKRSWLRVAGSGFYILCARTLLGLEFHDYSLAAKAFRREVVEKYRGWIGPDTSYVINLTFQAQRHGFRIVEIPVHCRDERESRFNLVQEAAIRFRRLFQLWLWTKLGLKPPWLDCS